MTRGVQAETMGERQVRAGEGFAGRTSSEHELDSGSVGVRYDLVGDVARGAGITRRSAARILSGVNAATFGQFKRNPEEFIARAAKLIVAEKARMVVQHVSYEPTGDVYDSSIFTETMPESLERAYRASKNVQDWVFPDGTAARSVERRFAEDLDAASEVAVYAKLPRDFTIPTPVGDYAPDWAIAFDREQLGQTVKHVFFIAETKGSLDSLELREVEKSKIECAKRLFNEISTANVRYHQVTTYRDLLDAIRGE